MFLAFMLTLGLEETDANKLAIVLLDGFKWDYLDRLEDSQAPALKALVAGGVRAEYAQTIYPAISFPSWTTIVTGLAAYVSLVFQRPFEAVMEYFAKKSLKKSFLPF